MLVYSVVDKSAINEALTVEWGFLIPVNFIFFQALLKTFTVIWVKFLWRKNLDTV